MGLRDPRTGQRGGGDVINTSGFQRPMADVKSLSPAPMQQQIPVENLEEGQKALAERARTYSGSLAEQVQDYRGNLEKTKKKAFDYSQEDARRNLAQQLAGVRSGMNSRGLLYSGLRQGEEGNVASDYAEILQSGRGDIENYYNQMTEDMENQAISAAQNALNAQRQSAESAYETALKERQARFGALSELGSAAGSIIGTAIGKGKK